MCTCVSLDVQQEKQHNELIQSVEGFNTDVLRKTETVEKSVLPNAEGNSTPPGPDDEKNACSPILLLILSMKPEHEAIHNVLE